MNSKLNSLNLHLLTCKNRVAARVSSNASQAISIVPGTEQAFRGYELLLLEFWCTSFRLQDKILWVDCMSQLMSVIESGILRFDSGSIL